MKKISHFLAMILLFSSLTTASEEAPASLLSLRVENGLAHGVGLGGTVEETWGFVYRKHFGNHFGIGATLGGGIRYSDGSYGYGNIGTSLGIFYTLAHYNFDLSILPNSSIRFLALNYFSHVYNIAEKSYHPHEQPDIKKASFEPGIGPGFGIEFYLNKFFALNLESAWTTSMRIDDKVRLVRSRPDFGGGFVFYF